jgi:hypothetical protein
MWNIPIYKQITNESKILTTNSKKCNECEEKEKCSEYHKNWICNNEE